MRSLCCRYLGDRSVYSEYLALVLIRRLDAWRVLETAQSSRQALTCFGCACSGRPELDSILLGFILREFPHLLPQDRFQSLHGLECIVKAYPIHLDLYTERKELQQRAKEHIDAVLKVHHIDSKDTRIGGSLYLFLSISSCLCANKPKNTSIIVAI